MKTKTKIKFYIIDKKITSLDIKIFNKIETKKQKILKLTKHKWWQ